MEISILNQILNLVHSLDNKVNDFSMRQDRIEKAVSFFQTCMQTLVENQASMQNDIKALAENQASMQNDIKALAENQASMQNSINLLMKNQFSMMKIQQTCLTEIRNLRADVDTIYALEMDTRKRLGFIS